MKKFSLSLISDVIFTAFITFILSMYVFGIFAEKPLNIVFSAMVAALSALAAFKFFSKKRARGAEKKREETDFLSVITQLNFMPKPDLTELFAKAYRNSGKTVEKKRGKLFIASENFYVFLFFGYEEPSKADVLKIFNQLGKEHKAIVFSDKIEEEVKEFCARFDGKIKLVTGKEVYDFLKKNNALPKIKFFALNDSATKKSDFRRLFNKKRAVNYFVFGLIFLVFSYFAPYKIYYAVCGAISLILSLFVRLFGKEVA